MCPLRSNAAEYSVQGQLVGHFGLRENAFGVTPDPRFLFLSQTHREALASLVNGIDCDFGFQILVAQPGMGKTTLLFNFLERFRGTAHTAFLFQPQPNPVELLQSILLELGTNSEETSLRKLSEQLNQVLTRAAGEPKRVIVVLDEAQNLDFSVLEALRQLSNFETASSKLMQIVLAGQPQLAKRLALPEQEQLMQRISAFGRLSPLALTETQAYIDHRLATAGYQGPHLFTQGAIRKIWDHSGGVPRNINKLCFNAMLLAFAEHAKSIDTRIIEEAVRDLDLNSVLADLYQMDASRTITHRKVLPMRDTNPSEGGIAGERVTAQPAAQGGILMDEEAVASVSQSSTQDAVSVEEKVPPAPTAAANVAPAVEEQKIAESEDASKLRHWRGPSARQRSVTHTNRVSDIGGSLGASGCRASPGMTSMRWPFRSSSFGSRRTTRRRRAQSRASATDANRSISRIVVHVGGGRTISFAIAFAIASVAVTHVLCVVSVSSCAGV